MYLADQTMSPDFSIELSLQEEPHPLNHSVFMQEEEDQDDDEEELPSFLQQDNKSESHPLFLCLFIFLANALIIFGNDISFPEPLSISEGLCVWCKLRKYPYWPAVVSTTYDFVQSLILCS